MQTTPAMTANALELYQALATAYHALKFERTIEIGRGVKDARGWDSIIEICEEALTKAEGR